MQVLSVGGEPFPHGKEMLGLLVLIEVDPPKKDQEKNGKDGQKAVKQDKEGVVPVGDRAVGIEASARGPQSSEILQILHAEAENKVQKAGFTGQHGDAPDELSPEDLPEAHNGHNAQSVARLFTKLYFILTRLLTFVNFRLTSKAGYFTGDNLSISKLYEIPIRIH